MPYWLDIDGGIGFGNELLMERRKGATGCDIVLIMISNAFCISFIFFSIFSSPAATESR